MPFPVLCSGAFMPGTTFSSTHLPGSPSYTTSSSKWWYIKRSLYGIWWVCLLFQLLCTLPGDLYHFILVYLVLLVLFLYYAAVGKISRKILYYLILSILLTTLIISVKVIPDIGVSGAVVRQDVIDPLTGGGSVETDLSSFVNGSGIDSVWAQYESGVMIGIIPVLLMIVALIYGRKEITIPAYFGIIFSFIWAGAGKTIFFFLHLLPIVNNLRNPGRIFGALLPLLLLLSLYGAVILYDRIKNGEGFTLSGEQKRLVALGIGLLILVKLCEIPYQEMITPETLVTAILIFAFVALLYFQKGTERNILLFFGTALIVNAGIILLIYQVIQPFVLIELLIIALLLAGLFIFMQKCSTGKNQSRVLCGILLAGIFIMMMGNLGSGYIKVYSPQSTKVRPKRSFSRSEIFHQVVVLSWRTNRIPIWHMDFTYWDVVNGIQPLSVHSAYYLETMPQLSYTIDNVTYYTPNYIVDTQVP